MKPSLLEGKGWVRVAGSILRPTHPVLLMGKRSYPDNCILCRLTTPRRTLSERIPVASKDRRDTKTVVVDRQFQRKGSRPMGITRGTGIFLAAMAIAAESTLGGEERPRYRLEPGTELS